MERYPEDAYVPAVYLSDVAFVFLDARNFKPSPRTFLDVELSRSDVYRKGLSQTHLFTFSMIFTMQLIALNSHLCREVVDLSKKKKGEPKPKLDGYESSSSTVTPEPSLSESFRIKNTTGICIPRIQTYFHPVDLDGVILGWILMYVKWDPTLQFEIGLHNLMELGPMQSTRINAFVQNNFPETFQPKICLNKDEWINEAIYNYCPEIEVQRAFHFSWTSTESPIAWRRVFSFENCAKHIRNLGHGDRLAHFTNLSTFLRPISDTHFQVVLDPTRTRHISSNTKTLSVFCRTPWFERTLDSTAVLHHSTYADIRLEGKAADKEPVLHDPVFTTTIRRARSGKETAERVRAFVSTDHSVDEIAEFTKTVIEPWAPLLRITFPEHSLEFFQAWNAYDTKRILEWVKDPTGFESGFAQRIREGTATLQEIHDWTPLTLLEDARPLLEAIGNPTETKRWVDETSLAPFRRIFPTGIDEAACRARPWDAQIWAFMRSNIGTQLVLNMLRTDTFCPTNRFVYEYLDEKTRDPKWGLVPERATPFPGLTTLGNALALDMYTMECHLTLLNQHEELLTWLLIALLAFDVRPSKAPQRVHCIVSGEPGCGKSYALDLLFYLLISGVVVALSYQTKRAGTTESNTNGFIKAVDEADKNVTGDEEEDGGDQGNAGFKEELTKGIRKTDSIVVTEDGKRRKTETTTYCIYTFFACMNPGKMRIPRPVGSRVWVRPLASYMRDKERNAIVDNYDKSENIQLNECGEAFAQLCQNTSVIAAALHLYIRHQIIPDVDVSVARPMIIELSELYKRHDYRAIDSRKMGHVLNVLRAVTIKAADAKMRELLPVGTPFSIAQAQECIPYLVSTTEHMCVAATMTSSMFVDPYIDPVLEAIVYLVWSRAKTPSDIFGVINKSQDNNYYMFSISGVDNGKDSMMKAAQLAIKNVITQRSGLELSEENIRDTLLWLDSLEVNSYGNKEVATGPTDARIPVLVTVMYSARNGMMIARKFVDDRIDHRTMRVKHTRTYAHLCREIIEVLRKVSDDRPGVPYVSGISLKFEPPSKKLGPLDDTFVSLGNLDYEAQRSLLHIYKETLYTKPYLLLTSGQYQNEQDKAVSEAYFSKLKVADIKLLPAYQTKEYQRVFRKMNMEKQRPYLERACWLGSKSPNVIMAGQMDYPYGRVIKYKPEEEEKKPVEVKKDPPTQKHTVTHND